MIETFAQLCDYADVRGWIVTLHAAHSGRTYLAGGEPARLTRIALWADPESRRGGVAIAGKNLLPDEDLDSAAARLAQLVILRTRQGTA